MAESILTKIVIRHFPDRAKPYLCIEQGNQAMILTTFRNQECRDLFEKFLGGNCMQREMSWLFEAEGSDAE